jgi:hypothetical protein
MHVRTIHHIPHGTEFPRGEVPSDVELAVIRQSLLPLVTINSFNIYQLA